MNRQCQQGFALEECEKIAIEPCVHLQSVAPVLNHVGINESGDNALTNQGLAQAFGKDRSAIGEEASGFGSGCHAKFHILPVVHGFDFCPAGQKRNCAKSKGRGLALESGMNPRFCRDQVECEAYPECDTEKLMRRQA